MLLVWILYWILRAGLAMNRLIASILASMTQAAISTGIVIAMQTDRGYSIRGDIEPFTYFFLSFGGAFIVCWIGIGIVMGIRAFTQNNP